MAYDFTAASSHHITVDVASVTALPLTMLSWANSNDVTTNYVIFALNNSGSPDNFILNQLVGASGDKGRAHFRGDDAGASVFADSSGTYTAGTWNCIVGVQISTSDRDAWLNNTSGTNTDASVAITGIDRTSIGRTGDSTPGAYFDGKISQCAIWNVELSSTHINVLYRGVNPFVLRNDVLKFYAPLNGNESPEHDYMSTNTLTVTGATKASTNPNVEHIENYL